MSEFGGFDAVALLQIDLKEIQDGALDVLGPGVILGIEGDAFNESIDEVEFAWHLEFFELLVFDHFFLEDLHGLNVADFKKFAIQGCNLDIFEAEGSSAISFEVNIDHGGKTMGSLLFDILKKQIQLMNVRRGRV